jgi:hypothetical protein
MGLSPQPATLVNKLSSMIAGKFEIILHQIVVRLLGGTQRIGSLHRPEHDDDSTKAIAL